MKVLLWNTTYMIRVLAMWGSFRGQMLRAPRLL